MKMLALILFLTTSLPSNANSQAIAGDPGTVAPSQQALQAVIESDPKVQAALKKCYDNNSSDVSQCLWDELDRTGDRARIRDLITKAQEAETAEQSSQNSNLPLSSTQTGASIKKPLQDSSDDPVRQKALQKLEEFYSGRLGDALKATDDKLAMTDQSVFYELAKTQLGKNVITAWSNVCMDAGWVDESGQKRLVILSKASDESTWKALRTQNTDELKTTAGATLSGQYFKCVAQLPMLCQKTKGKITGQSATDGIQASTPNTTFDYSADDYVAEDKPILTLNENPTGKTTQDSSTHSDIIKHSRMRACETVGYVDGLRRQLAATEKLAAIMKDDTSLKAKHNGFVGKTGYAKGEVDIDKLTTVTSGDLSNSQDSYYNTIGSNVALIEECKNNPTDPKCANIIANTEEERAQLRSSGAAFMLESEVIKEQLNDPNLSKDSKKTLLRRIRPNLNVDEIDVDVEIAKIKDAYIEERKNLVSSLAAQVKEMETAAGSSDATVAQKTEDVGRNILSRGNEYVQLMHFNNIISGFFDVEGGKSNIRVLDLELSNVAKLNDGQGISTSTFGHRSGMFNDSYAQDTLNTIKQTNSDRPIGASQDGTDQVNITSDQIGQFLDYEIQ